MRYRLHVERAADMHGDISVIDDSHVHDPDLWCERCDSAGEWSVGECVRRRVDDVRYTDVTLPTIRCRLLVERAADMQRDISVIDDSHVHDPDL